MWDILKQCEIIGAADSSIKKPSTNNLLPIIENSKISSIYCNGAAAYKLYTKYCYPVIQIPAVRLPSTSPANAQFSFDKLVQTWGLIAKYL